LRWPLPVDVLDYEYGSGGQKWLRAAMDVDFGETSLDSR